MTGTDLLDLWTVFILTCMGFVATALVVFLVVATCVVAFEMFFGPSILGEMIR